MDKLYSKQAKIIKSVFSISLAPLYILISALLTIEDAFLYVVFSIIPIGSLYTLPFWLSLVQIKKYRVSKISKYIICDSLYNFLPAIAGILISEIIVTVVNGSTVADGVATAIFGIIFVLISLIFWLLYYIFSYKK